MGSEADILDYPDLHYSLFPLTHLGPTHTTNPTVGKPPIVKYLSTPLASTKFNEEPLQSPSNATPFPHIISLPHPHHSSPCSSLNTLLYQSPSPELCSELYHVLIQCTPSSNLILSSRSSVGLTFLQQRASTRVLLPISHLEPSEPSPPTYNGGPIQRILPCEKRENYKGNILVGT